ncbi:MAG: AAA family ATPase [Moraxellaceae bacterium]|nr:AAA family ATPase [Moraxellaceae bacterium]MBL0231725.1 AAA family ATPase [Moraxellaceae bacterium]
MKISFENFGVINKGEIEQKPLTILCGENNTGKTYAMYAMYGLTTPLNIEVVSLQSKILPIFKRLTKEKIIQIDIKAFIIENILHINENSSISINMSIENIFNGKNFRHNSQSINVKYQENILLNNIYNNQIALNSPIFSFIKERDSYLVKIKQNHSMPIENDDFVGVFSYLFILALILSQRTTLFLPAERAGLNLFYSELNAYRTHLLHNNNTNKNDFLVSTYTKPIADYIDWLNKISRYKNQKSELFSSLSTTLQNNILGGSYSLDETNSINFHLNNQKDTLPLHLTSSKVKTYFGLWFYLQHMAQEGDVLMIDEPELSLHPNNQRKIARLLAQLVNKGIRVVISTHSDYMVREFNSLIMLGHAQDEKSKQELMAKYNYQEDELLTKDKVGAYLFHNNTIDSMEITKDEGIIATTFDEVINELNQSSDDIYYSLKDSHE